MNIASNEASIHLKSIIDFLTTLYNVQIKEIKEEISVYDTNFDFFSSGKIDLSSYTGNIYIAFKYKGSGTNTALDGTYEIDNIRIFNEI